MCCAEHLPHYAPADGPLRLCPACHALKPDWEYPRHCLHCVDCERKALEQHRGPYVWQRELLHVSRSAVAELEAALDAVHRIYQRSVKETA